MNFQIKRILVIFSVALNIGFMITSAVRFYCHIQASSHSNYFREFETAMRGLGLSRDQEKSVQKLIEDFKIRHDEGKLRFKETRNRIFSLLSMPAPFDQRQFEALHAEIHRHNVEEDDDVRNHLLELRRVLGDEKGALFFSNLLKQTETENRSH